MNVEQEAQKLRAQADYIEWVNTPEIKMTRLLHDFFCKENHTDVCGFGYEVDWKRVVDTEKGTAHAAWFKKAKIVIAVMQTNLNKLFEQLEFCEYECQGGPLELNVAYIKLKEILGVAAQEGRNPNE